MSCFGHVCPNGLVSSACSVPSRISTFSLRHTYLHKQTKFEKLQENQKQTNTISQVKFKFDAPDELESVVTACPQWRVQLASHPLLPPATPQQQPEGSGYGPALVVVR